jgi:hypothetical protein
MVETACKRQAGQQQDSYSHSHSNENIHHRAWTLDMIHHGGDVDG